MEKVPTAIEAIPHPSIPKDVWSQFVCDFPKCSKPYRLPENPKEKYKFLSALMMANILDHIVSWQQQKKFNEIYETLGRVSQNNQYPQILQKHILNVMKLIHTIFPLIKQFDYNLIENITEHQQKSKIVSEYLQNARKNIYTYLENQEGILTLFRIARCIALSLYLRPDYDNQTPVYRFLNSMSKENIIKQLISDDFELSPNSNHFVLEDYEIVAISHLLSIPIHYFINFFESKQKSLIKRRVHQQQHEEKTLGFFLDITQASSQIQTVRILFLNSDINFIQNIINSKKTQLLQNVETVQQIQQMIESLLNQSIHDFTTLNKFWIIKIIQILKSGEAQTLVSTREQTKINEQFKKEAYQLFSILNLDQKLFFQFLQTAEQNLQQLEELTENIIISQVTLIRDSITELLNNKFQNKQSQIYQSESQGVPKPKILQNNSLFQTNNNVTPSQFQQQKALNQNSRLIPKILDQDLPNYSDSSEKDLKRLKPDPQYVAVKCKEYDTDNDEQEHHQEEANGTNHKQSIEEMPAKRPPRYETNKLSNDVQSQKVQSFSTKKLNNRRQSSLDRMDLETSLKIQTDYLQSGQLRNSIIKVAQQNPSTVQIDRPKDDDNMQFQPKQSIINRMSNSLVMRQSIRDTTKYQKMDELGQSKILEQGNESRSEISMAQGLFCPICFSDVSNPDDMRTLHNDHKVCKSCLEDWIKVKFNAGQWNFKFFKCPIQQNEGNTMKPCSHVIDQAEIKNALSADEFRKLTEKAMKHGIVDIVCPNHNCQTKIKGMLPQDSNGLLCPKCNTKICWVCKNLDHGDSKCPQRIDEIKLALQDERVSCCPSCLEIYMKNEGCEHVSCTNCLIEFCFACSAPRPPILSHGAHYHRVGCQYRVPWWKDRIKKIENLEEEYSPGDCEFCQRDQKPCPRPMTLQDFKTLAHLNY